MLRDAPALRARNDRARGAPGERVRRHTADASPQGVARGPFMEFQPTCRRTGLYRARGGNGDG